MYMYVESHLSSRTWRGFTLLPKELYLRACPLALKYSTVGIQNSYSTLYSEYSTLEYKVYSTVLYCTVT